MKQGLLIQFDPLPLEKKANQAQTNIHLWVGGGGVVCVLGSGIGESPEGLPANEWGLTKYYTIPWCTRFGNGTASGKGKTNNAEKKLYFIIFASYFIAGIHRRRTKADALGEEKMGEIENEERNSRKFMFAFKLSPLFCAHILPSSEIGIWISSKHSSLSDISSSAFNR